MAEQSFRKAQGGKMKKIEKILIVIFILSIATFVGSFFSHVWIAKIIRPEIMAEITFFQKIISLVPLVFTFIIHLVIGGWLYSESKKTDFSPKLWFIFGCFFGIMAAVLFYLMKIYLLLSKKLENISM